LNGYRFNQEGTLTVLPGSPFDTGSCWDLHVDSQGQYLYAIGGSLTYHIDPSTGALTKIHQSSAVGGASSVFVP
jgi:6-phosphogluconolactonase (cycloisomerase 2 family)